MTGKKEARNDTSFRHYEEPLPLVIARSLRRPKQSQGGVIN